MNWYGTIFASPRSAHGEERGSRPQTQVPDNEIFARFFGGDNSALVTLFDRHNHRFYLYCLQFVHAPQIAEDLTQELWERLIRLRTDRPDTPMTNPMGLLVTMARNLCIDTIRKNRHHEHLDDLPESHHPSESVPELSHLEEVVILALNHLPMAQREVLALHAYSGYRFDEIAAMLGEPVGAIRTRAWRARTHLGRIIAAMVGVDDDRISDHQDDSTGEDQ